jgi:predicted XRE-type DNA-binding protein
MKMKRMKETPIIEGTQNVYADLGYADSEGMLIKARLVTAIAHILRTRSLTQSGAAKLLGLTQPKVSAMLKGQFRGISERRLLECLTRLGRDVQIVVKPAPRNRANGKLTLSMTSDRVA